MKLIPLAALSLATLAATVGCGSGSSDAPVKAAVVPTTEAVPTTLTTVMVVATTPTTVCVDTSAADLAAATARLRSNQIAYESFLAAGRDMAGAIAQVQLIIDNTGRTIAIYQREVAVRQAEYDNAVKVFDILGLDSARDKMTAAENNLADAKDLVASWEALRTKALGDLARHQATAATSASRAGEFTRQIALDQQEVKAAGVPGC